MSGQANQRDEKRLRLLGPPLLRVKPDCDVDEFFRRMESVAKALRTNEATEIVPPNSPAAGRKLVFLDRQARLHVSFWQSERAHGHGHVQLQVHSEPKLESASREEHVELVRSRFRPFLHEYNKLHRAGLRVTVEAPFVQLRMSPTAAQAWFEFVNSFAYQADRETPRPDHWGMFRRWTIVYFTKLGKRLPFTADQLCFLLQEAEFKGDALRDFLAAYDFLLRMRVMPRPIDYPQLAAARRRRVREERDARRE